MDEHQRQLTFLIDDIDYAVESENRPLRNTLICTARSIYRLPMADLERLTGLTRQHLHRIVAANARCKDEVPS